MSWYSIPRPRGPRWWTWVLVALCSAAIGGLVALWAHPMLYPYLPSLPPPAAQLPPAPSEEPAQQPGLSPQQPPVVLDTFWAVRVAAKVGPAVVGIINRSVVYDWWNRARVVEGGGSGVIFRADGYIVTNYHVVEGAEELVVILSDGRRLQGEVVGSDPPTDLAVVRVEADNLPTASFGDSDALRVGEPVVAIGNPVDMEFQRSVTAGVVSGLNRVITYGERVFRLIQTDAAINPGNSGGPLCNWKGEVVGINTVKMLEAEGMGFAIPSNTVQSVVADLLEHGRVIRPWLGVGIMEPATAARYLGVNIERGLLVVEVVEGSPAHRAGIREGDVILAMDDHRLNTFADLKLLLDERSVGQVVVLEILRRGSTLRVEVRLEEMPRSRGG